MEISVETSTDLRTWIAAASGTISADSPLGYWRLVARAVVEGGE